MNDLAKAVDAAIVVDDKAKFRANKDFDELAPRFIDNGGVDEFVNNPTDEGVARLRSLLSPPKALEPPTTK